MLPYKKTNPYASTLLKMIDRFLNGQWQMPMFVALYSDFYLDLPPGALPPEDFRFFSEVYDQLGWITNDPHPTDEALSDGAITERTLLDWIRRYRRDYQIESEGTDPT